VKASRAERRKGICLKVPFGILNGEKERSLESKRGQKRIILPEPGISEKSGGRCDTGFPKEFLVFGEETLLPPPTVKSKGERRRHEKKNRSRKTGTGGR